MTETAAEQQNIVVNEKKRGKTLYDASALEIFGKNFLAGFSHALGGVIIQIAFFLVLGYLATIYLWPQIQPMMNLLSRSVNSMEQLQQTMQFTGQGSPAGTSTGAQPTRVNNNATIDPQMVQQLMQQYLGGNKATPTPAASP